MSPVLRNCNHLTSNSSAQPLPRCSPPPRACCLITCIYMCDDLNGRVPGHLYFEACLHARTCTGATDSICSASCSRHPRCSIVSLHPRYACDFLKPAAPLEASKLPHASLLFLRTTCCCPTNILILQVQAFAQALRIKNSAWLLRLSLALEEYGIGSLFYQRGHAACGPAFADVAVQLHWGDVRQRCTALSITRLRIASSNFCARLARACRTSI
jgi:hypothetical protein